MSKDLGHTINLNKLQNIEQILIRLLSIGLPLFLFINYTVYPFEIIYSRVLTLCLICITVFLKFPVSRKLVKRFPLIKIFDYLVILAIILLFVFFYQELDKFIEGLGFDTPRHQSIFTTLMMVIVFEATRRVAGPVLPTMAIMLFYYAINKGYSYDRLMVEIASYDGLFGMILALAISILFIFMLFGNFLNEANFGSFLLKFGTAIAGGSVGGPAKVAIISSSIFGTISGSAVANVVATGSITIPMMKKLGFKPELAAAVEASASTGGMIMPPIMAAAAFIMAEILGIPYIEIVKSAGLAAIAFYVCVYAGVDAYARLNGIKGIPKDKRPSIKESFSSGGHLTIIVLGLVFLLVAGYSPMRSAAICTVLIFPISYFSKLTRLSFKKCEDALEGAMKGLLMIAPCCATIGAIIAIIGVTGLGGKIATSVLSIGGDSQLLILILVMFTCIIFGMALPATAAYLVCISIVGPTLVSAGILPLAAHMFVLYFATLSGITPPIAMAAYAGAGIADANIFKTAFLACALTSVAFIFPYIFVYNTGLLLLGNPIDIILPILPYVIVLPFSLSWFFWGYKRFFNNLIADRILNLSVVVSLVISALNRQVLIGMYIALFWVFFFFIATYVKKKKVIESKRTPLLVDDDINTTTKSSSH